MAGAGLEPRTAGLRVRRADHSATLPPKKKEKWKEKKSKVGCWDLWHIMLCINRLLILAPTLIEYGACHILFDKRESTHFAVMLLNHDIHIRFLTSHKMQISILCKKLGVMCWCFPPFLLTCWKFSPMPCTCYCGVNQQIAQRSCCLDIHVIDQAWGQDGWYWPGFFLYFYGPRLTMRLIFSHFDLTSLVSKGFILWLKQNIFVQNKAVNPTQVR